ncbi:asparagine synthase (glutamine-hydrolyzing) [Sphingomonas sp.]|uniref:asparagine synthase (glutamine-hydrolyzing) n=1 Tax=Sphingomonas sp. TaxID=28214 RepID=UPI00286C6918|nr:asparagine synthase (glutamine-hydrolyzing) [Sphingomonas sp.]
MCGIAGWFRRNGRPVARADIKAQCDAIAHRGPDDSGILTDGDFGFGMRRLSILDIAGGHQPMDTPDGRFAIVFNGEIFNHLEVREPLIASGYSFVTHSDTETILAAFSHWGNDAWARLEGMFAVAIWDRRRRSLTLARDPLGIKPLYISEQGGGLSFASELKALRVLPDHRFDVDQRAVHDFFSFGHVRRPRSIFHQVATLDPGHYLTFDAEGASRVGAYWRPRFHDGERLSVDQWSDTMRSMLSRTTARHMQADVPVAAFLSGGIDSSAILAAMTQATSQPIKAFTIGHPGSKIDETAAARLIANHLGCDHIVAPLEMADATEMLPQILSSYDEPFADMAAIPTWFASKLAAEHVKVVLCGEGGDELFAGYKRHRNARAIERLRPLLGPAGPLAAMIEGMPVSRSQRLNAVRQHALRFAEFIRLPDGYQQFFAATQISSRALRRQIYSPDFWQQQEGEDSYARLEQEYFPAAAVPKASALEQFLFADLTLNMPSAMLTRLDRASMAHSLEARVPFLSHKMVDWALTVPEDLKLRGRTGKLILRRAAAPWLPQEILSRPKQGFQIPMADWLRGRFGEFARETWQTSGAATAGYLDGSAVERLFREHQDGAADHSRMLYAITAFGIWWRGAQSAAPLASTIHAA